MVQTILNDNALVWTLWIQCRWWVLTVFVYVFIVYIPKLWFCWSNLIDRRQEESPLSISFNDRPVSPPFLILFIINYLSSVLFSVVPLNPSSTADERMLIPQWYLIKSKILQKNNLTLLIEIWLVRMLK